MKKSKITAIIITVILLAGLMPFSVSAAASSASAQLFDTDKTTQGNWVGTYGSDGYIIMTGDDSLESIPSYAAVTYADSTGSSPVAFWQWWATGTDDTTTYTSDEITSRQPGTLYTDSTKTSQIAACYYDGTSFTVTVDVGSDTKIVSLYILDYDQQSRESDITAYDGSGKALGDPVDAYGYDGGWYLKYKVSGTVEFEFDLLGGPNAVLSGIFFDPASSPAANIALTEATTTAEPTTTVVMTTAAPVATVTTAPAAGDVADTTTASDTAATTSNSSSSDSNNSVVWIIIIIVVVVIIVVIIIILATRKKK
ncbi:MAG: hypothetical protein FWD71_11325 [Oscillospiraceae bacterium]|nr:hypothetical protein [Oscillospiraceae bacterium]